MTVTEEPIGSRLFASIRAAAYKNHKAPDEGKAPKYVGIAFGKQIQTEGKRLGVTMPELARLAGISRSHMRAIEIGAVEPGLSTMMKLVRALEEKAEENAA